MAEQKPAPVGTAATGAGDLDRSGPANIGGASITDAEASGAIQEDGAKEEVDESHPAIDNNPRVNTTADMNRIDMNDPGASDQEAVAGALGFDTEQSTKVASATGSASKRR